MTSLPTWGEALNLLKEVGCSSGVIAHCKAVSKLAVKIARICQQKGLSVNIELVKIAALLHDIGRSKSHNVNHVSIGAEIAASFNIPKSVINVIERHIGAGIPAKEAEELGLPSKDYIPQTLEEKIVAYADKLILENRRVGIKTAIEGFSRRLGPSHPAIKRLKHLHNELFPIIGDLDK